MKIIIIIIAAGTLLFAFTDKNKKKKKNMADQEYSNVALNVVGHLENANFEFDVARYRLYRDNKFVAGGNTDKFGTLELYLMRNSHYLLDISTNGFVTKRIYFNTFVPENFMTVGFFDFETIMIPSDLINEEDLCRLDVPYAIVYFDTEKDEFDYDKNYTGKIMELEAEILSEISPDL